MKKPRDVEKPHQTVVDSFNEAETVQRVRTPDRWTDFIGVEPGTRAPGAPTRMDGTVPLLDDMTGVRQWE